MHSLKYFALIIILVPSISAFSLTKPDDSGWPWDKFKHPTWEAKCLAGSTKINFSFKSKSGEVDNDDMSVILTVGGQHISVNLGSRLFEALPTPVKLKNNCDLIPGYFSPEGYFLALLGVDDRPSPSRIFGILIDVKNRIVLEIVDSIGSYNQIDGKAQQFKTLQISNRSGGFEILLNQGYLKKSDSDGPDGIFFGKKIIKIENKKIVSRWEKPLPSSHNEWK